MVTEAGRAPFGPRRRAGRRSLVPGLVLGLAVFLQASLRPAALASASPAPPPEDRCVWTSVGKIEAVGDIHGDYENFVMILKGTGLIDANLHWTGGRTHLVQTGDILDRGPQAKDAFDLLMRLEKEAAAAGGMVHVLLGNHEEMNIAGIAMDYPNYVTVEQFLSFLPPAYKAEQERAFVSRLSREEKLRVDKSGLDPVRNERLREFWQNLMRRNNRARRAYVEGFNETYGNWLLEKNAVIKINDIVFAHAGISEKYSTWSLDEINSTLRTELEFVQGRQRHPQTLSRAFRPKIVYDPESPLWFRGLAADDEKASSDRVDRILERLGARYMVIGHNYFRYGGGSPVVRELANISRYGGKVYIIDTGISHYYGGVSTALIMQEGRFSLWEPEEFAAPPAATVSPTRDTEPPPSPADVEKFLRTADVVDVRKTAVPGRTEPWRIRLESDGVSRRAIFKYIDRRRPDVLPDSYHYELAAYELSKALGLGFVPPAVERSVEDFPGSVALFVEDAVSQAEMKAKKIAAADPEAMARALADLRVFVSLVNDNCENEDDILIAKSDASVHRVDFSQAFAPNGRPFPDCPVEKCSLKLYEKLLRWDDRAVSDRLKPYLNEEEIRSLCRRRRALVERIAQLIRRRGEANVLF